MLAYMCSALLRCIIVSVYLSIRWHCCEEKNIFQPKRMTTADDDAAADDDDDDDGFSSFLVCCASFGEQNLPSARRVDNNNANDDGDNVDCR